MTCSHYAQTHISDCLQGELEGGRNYVPMYTHQWSMITCSINGIPIEAM